MPRFGHLILLYNGQAGASTQDTVLEQAVPILGKACDHFELIRTETPEDFRVRCREAAEKADALFIAGGDGTLHEAVQILPELDQVPPIGILPTGTCNDFARTLEIPLPINEAAESLLEGEVREVDIAGINDSFFLNFAGIGLITDASSNIDPHLKERYGKLSYFMSALRVMRQADPFYVNVEIDGVTHEQEAVMVLVMNGRSIGTHQFPPPGIDPADGLLDVFLVQTSTIPAIFEWFSLSEPTADTSELEHVTHFQGSSIRIRTKTHMPSDTDGEIHLQTPLDIKVIPKKLKMLTPRL